MQYPALMDFVHESLTAVIGARVRQSRTELGWTLDRLAERAGVSRRMVISVEKGEVNPSIGTLLRLSDALGIGLPALVEPHVRDGAKVTRAGEGAVLWEGPSGGQGVLVSGTTGPDVVELWDWRFAPGESHESEAHAPGTRELLHLHDGSLVVEVGENAFTLSAGDALCFGGDEPHRYVNRDVGWTRFSLTVFEPGIGPIRQLEKNHGA